MPRIRAVGCWQGSHPSPWLPSRFSQDRTGLNGIASTSHRKSSGPDEIAVLDKGKRHSPRSPTCMGSGGSGSPCIDREEKGLGRWRGGKAEPTAPAPRLFAQAPLTAWSGLIHLPTTVIFQNPGERSPLPRSAWFRLWPKAEPSPSW